MKLKLSLMNDTVGFGWSRKHSCFGTKHWGFFYTAPKDSLAPSIYTVALDILEADKSKKVVQEHMLPERSAENSITVQAVVHEVPKHSQDNVNDIACKVID